MDNLQPSNSEPNGWIRKPVAAHRIGGGRAGTDPDRQAISFARTDGNVPGGSGKKLK
jgi:hypothetical protein